MCGMLFSKNFPTSSSQSATAAPSNKSGEPTEDRCPICGKTNVTHVTYVYGDELGQYAGRVKRGPELTEMAAEYGEFRVYVVEVCQSCGWNHLATSYVLGTGEPPVGRGRRVRPN